MVSVLGRGLVDVFHPAGIEIVAERLLGRHPHHVEAHRLGAALAHADHGLRGVVQREGFGRCEGEAEFRMQEAPAADKTFAGVFAIDDVVDRGEIGFAVALAALRRRELPRRVAARSARVRALPDATTGSPARADRARSCRPSSPRCVPSRRGSARRHRDRNARAPKCRRRCRRPRTPAHARSSPSSAWSWRAPAR